MAEKNCEIVLKVLMHCEGCKTKVSSCLRYFEGVEEVEVDYPNSRVVVKGTKADPLKVLQRVQKKFSKNAELISPKLEPETKEKKEPEKKEAVKVVVLKILMHCRGCETDIKNCLEGLKGVLNAEANMETSMVTVRGIVDPPKLIGYIKKQLGKHAEFVKQVEEIKDKDKDKDKDKGKDNNNKGKSNNNQKICPEVVEIRYQYPPQYSVEYIYPCQTLSDENPLACSIM